MTLLDRVARVFGAKSWSELGERDRTYVRKQCRIRLARACGMNLDEIDEIKRLAKSTK